MTAGEMSYWAPILPALVGGVLAISGGFATQIFIARRERETRERELDSDRQLLGALLSVRLEAWMSSCDAASSDPYDPIKQYRYEHLQLTSVGPFLLDDIKGNWLTLSPELIQKVHQLPESLAQANKQVLAYLNEAGQNLDEFLRQRAVVFSRLSAAVNEVLFLLRTETGKADPLLSYFSPDPLRTSQKVVHPMLVHRLCMGGVYVGLICLFIAGGIIYRDSQLESIINQGHYWSECSLARKNFDGSVLTGSRHVLKCGNRYEVVNVRDYEHATREWRLIQDPALSVADETMGISE